MSVKPVALGEVVRIDARIVDPTDLALAVLPHISAENISSLTGGLMKVQSAAEDGMESGKYRFDAGDVLYSKLRPYLRKAAIVDFAGLCSADIYPLKCDEDRIDAEYLRALLVSDKFTSYANEMSARSRMPKLNRDQLFAFEFELPTIDEQRKIATCLKAQLVEVEIAWQATQKQFYETSRLADAVILDSVWNQPAKEQSLGDVLIEVKRGIGASWADHPVLGATRDGLAPAKELPGKHGPKYKPTFPGTVFYNPMRILIGSIAFVDDDDAPGITSPDYVVLKGKPESLDSRWFYYWLRSPLGVECINSLARGAVRERMLFNRLSEGFIELPSIATQQKASTTLKELKSLRQAIESRLAEINLLPQKILAEAFEY